MNLKILNHGLRVNNMWDLLMEFEELLDKIINNTKGYEFDEIKQRIIVRLNELD